MELGNELIYRRGDVRQAPAQEAGSWKAARGKQSETAVQLPSMLSSPKFSSFGGGGAVSDVAIARFWCFGGDMTETAVTDLVGLV